MNALDAFDRLLASQHRATLDDAHRPATAALIEEACGATGNGQGLCPGHQSAAVGPRPPALPAAREPRRAGRPSGCNGHRFRERVAE